MSESYKSITGNNGYEYEVVESCPNTNRPIVKPIAWGHPTKPVPYYPTCMCCHGKTGSVQ